MRGRSAAAVGLALLALIAADFRESTAEAGFLKNGLRPGQPGRVELLRPPPPGARVRIRATVKPAPSQAAPAAPPPAAAHVRLRDVRSAAGAGASTVRWAAALAAMRARHARGLGRFDTAKLDRIRAAYGAQIEAAARRHNVSAALLLAVIAVESRGRPGAISSKGAQGLMQLIPATARRFGVADAFEPADNIAGGAAYLDWLLAEFRGDVRLALAGYNAGEGAVRRHGGVPPYPETRGYVALVMDALAAAHALCEAPPAGPRLPCRWKAQAS
jgi:soluble lytic murein transglycosylase-like protein